MCKIYVNCSTCKERKELSTDFFHKNRTTLSGFTGICKICKKKYKYPETSKLLYERNKEKIKIQSRARYLKLIESNPNYCKEFYQKHKHKRTEKEKEYRAANKQKMSEYNKKYKQTNKEKCAELSRKSMIKQRDLLSDSYVRSTIVTFAYNNGIHLTSADVTEDMIKMQRENIKLTRENNIKFLTL